MPKRNRIESESEEEFSEQEYEEENSEEEQEDDEQEELEEEDITPPTLKDIEQSQYTNGTYTNRQRVLIIASRGITARYRHLLEDFKALIPHHKKDNKLDDKTDLNSINEIADIKSCNQILYLETRKHQDLYLYLGKTPSGPSAKFLVVNIHTMDELKLTGNCMLGSRPLLNFDANFDNTPHFKLLKQILADAFGTPNGHPKSKPFLDRIMSFYLIKGNIWVRNYQIVDKSEAGKEKDTTLVEIGPRFVLIPIRIFLGSLGGPTLYQNLAYVSPNSERSEKKKFKGDRYRDRVDQNLNRKRFLEENPKVPDELSNINVFK